jgi:hypothetical protein
MAVPTDVNSPLNSPSHTGEHQRVSDALATLNPTWIALPLVNGWGNYGGSPSFELASYCKVNNFVYLQGLIISGTSNTIFTLPVGYRPVRVHLGVLWNAGPNAVLRWDLSIGGVFTHSGAAPTATSHVLGLTGLFFSTTALP